MNEPKRAGPAARRAPESDVVVTGIVRAPVDMVWRLFRPFGAEVMRWWPIYDWVTLEPPGRDEVGAVRHFKANGRVYRERLVLRSDATHTEQYAYVDSNVPIQFTSILTTVQMRSVNMLETEVTWSSRTELAPLFRPTLPVVRSTQRRAYWHAIESLDRYFNPATEVLELHVVDASINGGWGLVSPNPYATAQIGSRVQRTAVRPFTKRPKWRSDMRFNVGAFDKDVAVSLWDAALGRDTLMGTAKVEIPSFTNGEIVEKTLQLEGPHSGTVTVSMQQRPEFEVLKGTMSLVKSLGSALGRFIPPLGQLALEIEMLDTAVAGIESAARTYLGQTLGLDLRGSQGPAAADNLPGAFLIDLGKSVGDVHQTIQGLTGQFLALARQVVESIKAGEQEVYAYQRYPRLSQIPDVPLENLPKMVAGLPLQELLSAEKLGRMVGRGLEYLYAQFDLPERYKKALLNRTDPFEAFFGGAVTRPNAVVDHWKDDTEFCRQFIQGVNPLVIRLVRSKHEIPLSMMNLSAQGESLDSLIGQQRLFILDYARLSKLKLYRDMVFYAPIVLVYRHILDDGSSHLDLVAIQLTREEHGNIVYTKNGTPPNRYLFAKIQVACADNQYHQFISHLGLAHLATEPFVVAHHNAFGSNPGHPIGALLAPHMEETIGINYLARQTLVSAEHAFTDKTFAPGTAQALELFLEAYEKYDFLANSFPNELASRGFDEAGSDGVQNYYYREDGFKIWHALEDYVREVVETVYSNDAAVLADPTLQNWVLECHAEDRAAVPGFPSEVTTRGRLTQVLTTLIFHASAFHSAVNFPQFDYLTYVPGRPDATLAKMPDGADDISMEFIYWQALPRFPAANFQVSFAVLLTLPSDKTLAALPVRAPELRDAHATLLERLKEISVELRARNDKLVQANKQPYPYLIPENIAASVAI